MFSTVSFKLKFLWQIFFFPTKYQKIGPALEVVLKMGLKGTPAACGLEELFSAVLERFLEPIQALAACVLQELGWKYT